MNSQEQKLAGHRGGRAWLVAGAVLAGLSVAFGAFGAHGLESSMNDWYPDPEQRATRLENWETAARYQMYHALGLIGLGLLAQRRNSRATSVAGVLFLAGTLIFSGSLYLLVLTDVRVLGAVVPLGGTLQLAGWVVFTVLAARLNSD